MLSLRRSQRRLHMVSTSSRKGLPTTLLSGHFDAEPTDIKAEPPPKPTDVTRERQNPSVVKHVVSKSGKARTRCKSRRTKCEWAGDDTTCELCKQAGTDCVPAVKARKIVKSVPKSVRKPVSELAQTVVRNAIKGLGGALSRLADGVEHSCVFRLSSFMHFRTPISRDADTRSATEKLLDMIFYTTLQGPK